MSEPTVKFVIAADSSDLKQEVDRAASELKRLSDQSGRSGKDMSDALYRAQGQSAQLGKSLSDLVGVSSSVDSGFGKIANRVGDFAQINYVLGEMITRSTQISSATNGAAASGAKLQTVMGFLGGPVGVITLAASALGVYAVQLLSAKNETDKAEQSNRKLAESFDKVTVSAAANRIVQFQDALEQIGASNPRGAETLRALIAENEAIIKKQFEQESKVQSLLERLRGKKAEQNEKPKAAAGGKATTTKDPEDFDSHVGLYEGIESSRQKILGDLESSLLTEEQKIGESYARRMLLIDENVTNQIQAQRLRAEVTSQFEEEITRRTAEQEARRAELRASAISNAANAFTSLTSIFANESKKAFKIHQAAAIAETTINSYQAYTKALATIPAPFNIAAAASILAAGLAKVHAISSMSPGSAGVGAGSSPVISPSTVATSPPGPASQPAQPKQTTVVPIYIGGQKVTELIVDGVVQAINGDQLVLRDEKTYHRIVAVS